MRVYAWLRVVTVWTSSRSDDLVWVRTMEVTFQGDVLELRLRRTETSGPGKRIESTVVWVSSGAWLVAPD